MGVNGSEEFAEDSTKAHEVSKGIDHVLFDRCKVLATGTNDLRQLNDWMLPLSTTSGTPSSTTYLRGDRTWATPAGGSSSDYVNALSIGCVGDGVTDNSSTISNYANAHNGGALFFPAGSYYLGSLVTLPNSFGIVGAGFQSIFIVPVANASAFSFGDGFNELRDVRFKCVSNAIVAGTMIKLAVHTLQGRHYIHNVYIDNCWDGIWSLGSTYIDGLIVTGNRNVAVKVTATYAFTMTHFLISSFDYIAVAPINTGIGILLDGTAATSVIQDVRFSDGDVIFNDIGMKIIGPSNNRVDTAPCFIKVDSVLIDTQNTTCLYVSYSRGATFTNSWLVQGKGGPGINLNNAIDYRFVACDIMASVSNGINLNSGCQYTKISDCTISQNGGSGIAVAAGVTDFIVQGNNLGPAQIHTGFWSVQSQTNGITIATGASDRYIVADNLVSGNGGAGVVDNGSGVNKRVANNY
jgi:hypothetical protein